MLNVFKKIGLYLNLFWHSLFFGMKNAETIIMNSKKSNDDYGVETPDDSGGGVFKDILNKKLTQEVKELRYSSYAVANESKRYKYIGDGKAEKKTESQLSEKHGYIDESDNLPVIVIQDCSIICEDVLTVLNEVNKTVDKKVFSESNLKIKHNIFPRFLIESYIKKIVVKKADGNYVIDLYCSKYPRQFNEKKDRAFLTELKKIKNKEVRDSDILDISEISFITSNAWGVDDWYRFTFKDFELYDIIDFDGNYIIRLGCQTNAFMETILSKIYCQSAVDKYNKKERKENAVLGNWIFKKPKNIENHVIDFSTNSKLVENND